MGDQTHLERIFLESLPLIDRTAASLARRNGLNRDEADDFVSWVKLRIIEADYAVLRSFRGESAIGTYLTVVIAMLARDYRVQRFGRWRPSAIARRLGAFAMRLEVLVRRQGYRLEEAGELLRTAGETQLSDRELGVLLAQLPVRSALRPAEVGADALEVVEANSYADSVLLATEVEADRAQIASALASAINRFAVEDRLILRMRFYDELAVADIARALSLPQKPLYKRIDRLLSDLRRQLTTAGFSAEQCRGLLLEPAADV